MKDKRSSDSKWQSPLLVALLTTLCVACFPANPLVLTHALEVESYPSLFIIGWVAWAFGMLLIVAPIVMFPRRGDAPEGKCFVNTTRLVDTGIYRVVRHPQSTGGLFAIFLTTLLWYPHWLFEVLGVAGAAIVYLGCMEEDRRLVNKFGNDYVAYVVRVPRVNFALGLARLIRQKPSCPAPLANLTPPAPPRTSCFAALYPS